MTTASFPRTSSRPTRSDDAEPICVDGRIDPRGPRFGGAVTTLVLAAALVAGPGPLGIALLAWQTVVFALGGLVGLHAQPYGVAYRRLVQPRLGPPADTEDAAPPRFAQLVGLGFAAVGLVSWLVGWSVVGYVAVAAALAAAFLNAAFGFCLGCEMYLLGRRLRPRRPATVA